MAYRIVYTAHARDDLREVFFYLTNVLFQKRYISNFLIEMDQDLALITDNPYLFSAFTVEPWYSRGWRRFTINKYVVFYQVDDKNKTVYVMAVFYGSRDIEAILRREFL